MYHHAKFEVSSLSNLVNRRGLNAPLPRNYEGQNSPGGMGLKKHLPTDLIDGAEIAFPSEIYKYLRLSLH